MSLDATRWAWEQTVGRSAAKLVLLAIADRTRDGQDAEISIGELALDTELNRKTVMSCLSYLAESGLLSTKKTHGGVTHYWLLGEPWTRVVSINRKRRRG